MNYPELLCPSDTRQHNSIDGLRDVSAGTGDSGDAVRVVTDIALVLLDKEVVTLDETNFWRLAEPIISSPSLSPMVVVALVKFFLLEWSNDSDYQMYHDFPLEMYLG